MNKIISLSIVVMIIISFIVVPSVQTASGSYAFYTKWGATGSGNGQFRWPWNIAVDSSGRVYVADTNNNRIQKFLLASVCPASSIQIVPGVCLVRKWGEPGSGNGQFLSPLGIATDLSGRVYVVDANNHRIQMFRGVGTFIRAWGIPFPAHGFFSFPIDVAVDSLGYVYVADEGSFTIKKFQLANPCPTGTTQVTTNVCFVTMWGTSGTGNGQFSDLTDIAVDPHGNVYTADNGNNRIQKFQFANPCPTGTTQVVAGVCFVTTWGNSGSGIGQFHTPLGISVDTLGYVYVADSLNNRIQKFQLANPCPTGTTQVVAGVCFVTTWGTIGFGNGQFYIPSDVAIDSSGKVYVSDLGNNRTQVFYWKTDVGGTGGGGTEPGIAANQTVK